MTTQEVVSLVQNHPAGKVKIAIADIDGILRGKYISTDKFISIATKGTSFCNVIMGWDSADVLYDKAEVTGWHTGYPDSPATIALETMRHIPWENNLPFFLAELNDESGEASPVCPRQLLKKVIAEANAMGFNPVFAQEFEWFNFQESPSSAQQKNYHNLNLISPGMFGYSILRTTLNNPFFDDLFNLLCRFGIPIEGLHTETGPGTFEAAIAHASALEAADRAVLFKTAVKEIAYKHGIMATFMAKIHENLPGCGGHVHQSLWDTKNENNLFHDENDPLKLSSVARSYIAGQLHCLPFILPLFAPTVNSYKRLVEGAWAPTTLTWGIDNRTTALRVLNGSKSASRLETRVIGADVNPYLAIAACLASGLYGIKYKMQLEQNPTTGNGYRVYENGTIPHTLADATKKMKESEIASALFGSIFTNHFVQSREWEWKQHLKAVTDWEFKRYFEII